MKPFVRPDDELQRRPAPNPSDTSEAAGFGTFIGHPEAPRGESMLRQQDEMRRRAPEEAPRRAQPAPPVCIPADVLGMLVDPLSALYNLGDPVSFTPDTASGTEPITYEWYLNGALVFTGETFNYTVADGDIVDKDVTGLGHFRVKLIVRNDCNEAGTETEEGTFDAQGTPP